MKLYVMILILLVVLNSGCALVVNKEQIHANAAIDLPPDTEMRIGVLPLLVPDPTQTDYAGYWGGDGTIRTLENSGQIVADAITAVMLDVKNFTLIGYRRCRILWHSELPQLHELDVGVRA